MPGTYILKIECKAYIVQWLYAQYGHPCQFPATSEFRGYLQFLLGKQIKHYDSLPINYNDMLMIELSMDNFYRFGFEMSKTNTMMFNAFAEGLFKREFRMYVEMINTVKQVQIKDAILQFMNKYQIQEEHISFDGLKKDYYRNVTLKQRSHVNYN